MCHPLGECTLKELCCIVVLYYKLHEQSTVFAVIIAPPQFKSHPAQEHNFLSLNLAPPSATHLPELF